MVPNDAYQGAGLASFAKSRASSAPTSSTPAETRPASARRRPSAAPPQARNRVTASRAWNTEGRQLHGADGEGRGDHPDAVLLAGLTEENGGRLIKDKVAVLGANNGMVKLLAPDGFAQQSTIDLAGAAAKGMFASVPGPCRRTSPAPARSWSSSCEAGQGPGRTLCALRRPGGRSVLLGAIGSGGAAPA